jgi:SNF2 family DNA or RNA helicase
MLTRWDLVVIDEAHRLRNVYKTGNKIARALRSALTNVPKVLLTATPLQNSLIELYGLVSFIDKYAFENEKSFRAKYARLTSDDQFSELKSRLKPLCIPRPSIPPACRDGGRVYASKALAGPQMYLQDLLRVGTGTAD